MVVGEGGNKHSTSTMNMRGDGAEKGTGASMRGGQDEGVKGLMEERDKEVGGFFWDGVRKV